jgi:hypothetical protein
MIAPAYVIGFRLQNPEQAGGPAALRFVLLSGVVDLFGPGALCLV